MYEEWVLDLERIDANDSIISERRVYIVREFDELYQTINDTIHTWIDSLWRWYDS